MNDRWLEAFEEARREVDNWRCFALWWFATSVLLFSVLLYQWLETGK